MVRAVWEVRTMAKKKSETKSIKVGTLYRAAQFDTDTIDKTARTVEMSFSSEEPYERYFGMEILGHNPGEVRMDRLNNGAPLLVGHNTGDQVGIVEKAYIGQDRKGRALVRFGKSARAEEVFQDVIDGIRVNTSVSYDVNKMVLMKEERDVETYRVTDWTPLEVSLVSVPADTSVGVGRGKEQNEHELIIEIPSKEERQKMKKCNICGFEYEGDACPVCARAKALTEEKERSAASRVNDILAMGRKHDLMDDAQKFITEGKSVQEFKDLVIEKITAKKNDTMTFEIPDQPIYRGSSATMLGSQLMDIATIYDPTRQTGDREVREARSRIEQSQKRSFEKLTKQLKEERAATSGGMQYGVPNEGGVFLQGETSVELITNGFNNSAIIPRCAKRTLTATQYVKIIGIDEESRVTGSRGGGLRVYTNKELGDYTASKTKFKEIRIEPQKLTGLFAASDEMMQNVTFLGQEIRQLFGEEYAFKCQDLVIRGTGAGEAKGILTANCLVPVPKETGQAADTIKTANLSKMWARFNGRSPVWFINRDCGPQLDELSITAGTAALEPRFVTYDAQGIMRIKGAPVVEIEQCATLGDLGDIILCDWSQYVCADKGDIQEATSIHVDFVYGQQLFRFTYYFDGQPRWSSAITPYKGTGTLSPFVALAARA
jgi:HK97 family phage major capsid protein